MSIEYLPPEGHIFGGVLLDDSIPEGVIAAVIALAETVYPLAVIVHLKLEPMIAVTGPTEYECAHFIMRELRHA